MEKNITVIQSNYGLLIPYTSLNASKILANLLAQNVRVRFASNPFTYSGKLFDRGTLIVLKGNNLINTSNPLIKGDEVIEAIHVD